MAADIKTEERYSSTREYESSKAFGGNKDILKTLVVILKIPTCKREK